MGLFFHPNQAAPSGLRLTGFARYTEVLERNFKKLFLTGLMTLLFFLPFGIGAAYAVLSSSLLVMLLAGVFGGILAGPALSCMYDAVFRGLRDAAPKFWSDYVHAWKQNFRSSIIPGILTCVLLGFDIFMAMLFYYSATFPGFGTIALYLFSVLALTMVCSIVWPQIVLFDQPLVQTLKNSLLFILRYFPKALGAALLQILYWGALLLLLPWTALLWPLTGFWLILYTANFLLYNTLNGCFEIEDKIAAAFPKQAVFYETDEAWIIRKQKEAQNNQGKK